MMFPWISQNRFVYILSNLLVLPATFFPFFDFISNISFFVAFVFMLRTNFFSLLVLSIVFILKNNANYRFNFMLKQKGEELSKSDYECVYLYAWCTLLRYFLIGLSVNQIFVFFR